MSYKNRVLLKLLYSVKRKKKQTRSQKDMDTFGQADNSEYGSQFSENQTYSQNQSQILTKIEGQYPPKSEKRKRGRPRKSATLGYSEPAMSEIQSRTNDDQISKSNRGRKKKTVLPKLQQSQTDMAEPKRSKTETIVLKPFEPKQLQLCEALLILKKKLPNRSLQKVIIRLHEAIHTENFRATSYNPSSSQTKIQHKEYEPNGAFSTTNTVISYRQKSNSSNAFKLEEKNHQNASNYILNYKQLPQQQMIFYNPIQAQRYKQRKKLAKIYLERGYGVTKKIDSQLPEIEMERNHYKSLLYGVLTAAFRRLQSFLFNDCKRPIKYLNRPQMKTITYPLLNSRVKLVPLHCETFFKFITLCYNLSDVTIAQSDAVDLYVGVMKFLHGRNVTMEALQNIGRIDVKRNIEKSDRQRGLDIITTSKDYNFEDIGDDFTLEEQQIFPLLDTLKNESIEENLSYLSQQKGRNQQYIEKQTR